MSKNTEIKFVGQPIFKQAVNLIDGINLTSLVNKYNADYYYKAFKAKKQLITVLFGIFSRCDSMTEICEGLRAMSGKLNLLGLEKAPRPKVRPAMECEIGTISSLKMFILVWYTIIKVFCRTAGLLDLRLRRSC